MLRRWVSTYNHCMYVLLRTKNLFQIKHHLHLITLRFVYIHSVIRETAKFRLVAHLYSYIYNFNRGSFSAAMKLAVTVALLFFVAHIKPIFIFCRSSALPANNTAISRNKINCWSAHGIFVVSGQDRIPKFRENKK